MARNKIAIRVHTTYVSLLSDEVAYESTLLALCVGGPLSTECEAMPSLKLKTIQ